jgi:hypothetical protein
MLNADTFSMLYAEHLLLFPLQGAPFAPVEFSGPDGSDRLPFRPYSSKKIKSIFAKST